MVTLLPESPEPKAVKWLAVDDTMRETYGYLKEGVGYGYHKVKRVNALLAIASTAVTGPIIIAHWLRKGPVSSAHGAGHFLADAITAARPVYIAQLQSDRRDPHRRSAVLGHREDRPGDLLGDRQHR